MGHNVFKHFSSGAIAGNAVYTATNDLGRPIQLLYGHTTVVTNATAASRRVVLEIRDADGAVVHDVHSGATFPASQTNHAEFMQGVYRETTVIANSLQVPFGMDFIIPPGWSFAIVLDAGVAGDTHTTHLMCQEI